MKTTTRNVMRVANVWPKKALATCCALFVLAACGEEANYSIGAQDKAFIATVKQHLQKEHDTVLASTLHSGGWEAVCVNPLGAYASIEVDHIPDVGFRPNKLEIINGPTSTYANDKVWGIYFRYPGNKIEYYRIPVNQMNGYYEGHEKTSNCVSRALAQFIVSGDLSEWTDSESTKRVAEDFIEIKLIESENK